jgi:hypothetical protein
MHHKCPVVRMKICPREMAGEAKAASPREFWLTSSNCGDALTTHVSPSSSRK